MTSRVTSPEAVLATIEEMLREILEEYDTDDLEVTMTTSLYEDLELESIDLVDLASRLYDHYGERVNLAEWLAEKELEDIIGLRVGQLVDYVVSRG
jgi:acyl carrier protein